MDQVLFADFLTSKDRYRECEAFWESTIESIEQKTNQGRRWYPWMHREDSAYNYATFAGNPIIERVSSETGRGFRIIQLPSADSAIVSTHLEDYSGDRKASFREGWPVIELVIQLTLTNETLQRTSKLLAIWMDDRISTEQVKQLVGLGDK